MSSFLKFSFLFFLVCNSLLFAADKEWVGGSGDWDVPAKWSPAAVPTPADNVIFKSEFLGVDVSIIGELNSISADHVYTFQIKNWV